MFIQCLTTYEYKNIMPLFLRFVYNSNIILNNPPFKFFFVFLFVIVTILNYFR